MKPTSTISPVFLAVLTIVPLFLCAKRLDAQLLDKSLQPVEVKTFDFDPESKYKYGSVEWLNFSRDGHTLIALGETSHAEYMLIAWDISSGKLKWRRRVRTFGHEPFVMPVGQQLIAEASTLQFLSTETGEIIRDLPECEGFGFRTASSEDGRLLASSTSIFGAPHKFVRVWEVSTGKILTTLEIKADTEFRVVNLHFFGSATNGGLLAVTDDGRVHMVTYQDMRAKENVHWSSESKWVMKAFSVIWAGDGETCAILEKTGPIWVGSIHGGKLVPIPNAPHDNFWSWALDFAGRILVVSDTDGNVSGWNMLSKEQIFSMHLDPPPPLSEHLVKVAVSPNGQSFATGGPGRIITVWNME